MNRSKCLLATIAILTLPTASRGDLVINITGTTGSNVITFEALGSVTVTSVITGESSSSGRAPGTGGTWDSTYDNNIGDPIIAASSQTNVNLSSVVTYFANGTSFGTFDQIDFGATATPGGDDIGLDPAGTLAYPTLAIGDVVSWSGTGTFSLGSGETFDTFFQTGSFSNPIDGGSYIVNITEASAGVPEPASGVLMAFVGVLCCARRPRRQ